MFTNRQKQKKCLEKLLFFDKRATVFPRNCSHKVAVFCQDQIYNMLKITLAFILLF